MESRINSPFPWLEALISYFQSLKEIDDENYQKQLNGYRNYIEKKTNKQVECYLYSIMDEEYKKIEK